MISRFISTGVFRLAFAWIAFFSTSALAQTFQGYHDAQSGGGFSYNVTVSVVALPYNSAQQAQSYKVRLTSAVPDIRGYYDLPSGKYFTCADIGSICAPDNFMRASVELAYQCNNTGTESVVFTRLNEEKTVSFRRSSNTACTISLESVYITTDHSRYRERILELKFPKSTTAGNSNTSGSAKSTGHTPANATASPASVNTTQPAGSAAVASTTAGNDTNSNPVSYQNASSDDKFTRDIQNATAIINSVAPLVEQWATNRQRRWEEEQRRREKEDEQRAALSELNKQKAEQYFKTTYLDKYLKDAESGNEYARMLLYFKHSMVESACSNSTGEYIPCNIDLLSQRGVWLEDALKNNNRDILNVMGAGYLNSADTQQKGIEMLEKAANLGSLDAMIQLGDYFDRKPLFAGHTAGQNADKAFHWYSKAAENGCPKGMYYMGMIYRYGYSRQLMGFKKSFMKYNIEKDNKKALEWFTKSVTLTNHIESLYAQSTRESLVHHNLAPQWISASIFDPNAFSELSKLYEEGKGVERNDAFSKELYQEHLIWRKRYNTTEN